MSQDYEGMGNRFKCLNESTFMDEYERERQKLTEDFRESCESFTVLGDPHRQRIIIMMLESRCYGMSVQEITECVNLSRPAVSYHLKVLKQAGIVTMHRKGTSNLYCLDVESDVWHRFRDITTEVCSIIDRIRANGFPIVPKEE